MGISRILSGVGGADPIEIHWQQQTVVNSTDQANCCHKAGKSAVPLTIESPRKDIKTAYGLPLYLDKVSPVSSRVMTIFNFRMKRVINKMHHAEIKI